MTHWFDALAVSLARPMPRRGTLRILGGLVAGVALGSVRPATLEAKCDCPCGTGCCEISPGRCGVCVNGRFCVSPLPPACLPCEPPLVGVPSNCPQTCVCPPPPTGGAPCPAPQVQNPRTCACTCPPVSCPPPFVQNPRTCACTCPRGVACRLGETLNPFTCQCCPPTSTPVGAQCCPDAQVCHLGNGSLTCCPPNSFCTTDLGCICRPNSRGCKPRGTDVGPGNQTLCCSCQTQDFGYCPSGSCCT